ncbi:MAG TPA: hypothetical protein VGB15_17205 [Longimicrobium sp.]|jgi:hypothetical protein
MRPLLPAVAAFCAVMACAPRRQSEPLPHAGKPPNRCYALTYPGNADAASVFPARLGFVPGSHRVLGRPSPAGERFWAVFGSGGEWSAAPGDSVRVSFSNGFSALVLMLRTSGDSLAGQAWFASDVISDTPPPRSLVAGARSACDPAERW